MLEFDYLTIVNGGSRGDGAANDGYGSYVLSTKDDRRETVRLALGTVTASVAVAVRPGRHTHPAGRHGQVQAGLEGCSFHAALFDQPIPSGFQQ